MEKLHFNRNETVWTRKEEISVTVCFPFFLSLSLSLSLFPAWLVSTLGVAPRKDKAKRILSRDWLPERVRTSK